LVLEDRLRQWLRQHLLVLLDLVCLEDQLLH
jgi:hypothetical protein